MFDELKSLELQIIELQQKKEELKKNIINKHAKYSINEGILHPITINNKRYKGGVIEDVVLGGGYTKNPQGGQKFNDYWFCYTFRPLGENEGYLLSENELIERLK